MRLTQRNLTGKAHLTTVTDLLQRIRLEGAFAGLYEAADLQWWWREDGASIPAHQTYWFDAQGRAVACLLRFDAGAEWNNDFIAVPSARQAIQELVVPEVVAAISDADKVTTISVRDDDMYLQHAIERVGFVRSPDVIVQAEITHDPARTHLPSGFHLSSRVEDERPHHLIRRNGPMVVEKLHECSLYRPELDLCVRDAASNVAAYALFWMDDVTKVGLLEPMRTERDFQRMGLARHLIGEGVARLRALGALSIRVAYSPDNEAAARLYHQAGFEDRVTALEYRREPDA